ncbi:putative ribonuclease H-like domain-containing protein, partial [Tanacetum coccineum]
MSNITTTYPVPSTPNTRIHKDHSLEGKTHEDLHTCLFACFLSQEEPKKVIQALKDPSWIEAMQEELLQFKLQQARLVAQGYTQEKGINYDEVFAPVARIEAIRLFLAYASFKDFVVYQMDVKSAFLYGKIEEEVYVCQPPGFEDPEFPNRVYKVEKALYGLHQAPRAWTQVTQKDDGIFIIQDKCVDEILKRSMIGSLMYLTSSRPDIMFVVCACARFQDSPFDLKAYTDSNYAGASLDKKSTTGGCKFLGIRLISWECKKQNVVASS